MIATYIQSIIVIEEKIKKQSFIAKVNQSYYTPNKGRRRRPNCAQLKQPMNLYQSTM